MRKGLVLLVMAGVALLLTNGPYEGRGEQKQKGQNVPTPPIAIVDNSSRQTQANPPAEKPPDPHAGIEWSNWALVLVGALGVLAAFVTLQKIGVQADEMKLQRTAMQDTLTAIQRQAESMDTQATHMESQTKILGDSVAVAKTSADIAVGVSVPTLKIVEFEVINLGGLTAEQFFQSPRVAITIRNYGQTPAFLAWWSLCFTCEDLPDIPVYEGPASGMLLKGVAVQPGEPHVLPAVEFFRTPTFSSKEVQAIIKREKLLTAYGYICYGDVFNRPLQRFKFCKTVLNIFPDEQICDWWDEFAGPAYTGVDQLWYRGTKEQKAENPN
jgi:hypothetical protein